MTSTQMLFKKLYAVLEDLGYMKRPTSEVDAVLMEDDVVALRAADADLRSGRTKRLRQGA